MPRKMVKEKFSRATIKAFREHLNKAHGFAVDRNGRAKTGARTRLYGDYLYAQDRCMFMASLEQEIERGDFKP